MSSPFLYVDLEMVTPKRGDRMLPSGKQRLETIPYFHGTDSSLLSGQNRTTEEEEEEEEEEERIHRASDTYQRGGVL
jgi:hypothetical protein